MSLSTMRDLNARMRLDTSHFSQGLRKLEADTKRTAAKMGQAFQAFALGFAGGVAGGLVTGAIDKMTSGVKDTVREIAAMGDEAKRSGLGLRAFQEWSFVAQQNRVSLDALVDGFKELSLRADEWIVTGGGAAAEAFQRLGFSAVDLKDRLKDPSALMLEIIGRLQGLDQAARIRITDELFGGTGGEQFVQLIDQGEAGLRRTIDRAHELGRVMDEEAIQKATELDQKWNELADRVETFAKRAAVALADLPFAVIEDRIGEIFNEAEGRQILGDEVYDQLRKAGDLSDEQLVKLTALRGEWSNLAQEADRTANALAQAAGEADMMGLDSLWEVLAQASNEMRKLADDFADGAIDAETFRAKMDELQRAASAAFNALDDADRVNFSGAISEVDRLGGVIASVTIKAQQLYSWLKAAAGAGSEAAGVTTGTPLAVGDIQMPPAEGAPRTSPKPKAAPSGFFVDMDGNGIPDVVDDARKKASGGGKSKGGGGAKDDFGKSMSDWRVEVEGMLAEASALNDLQLAFDEYGIAVDVARRKAELLQEAKEAGKTITPELRAEIDKLANSYADAATKMEMAKQRHEDFKSAVEQTKGTLSGVFTGLVTGAQTFRQALGNVIAKLGEMIAMKGFEQLWSGGLGKGVGGILKALGFSRGGYTGDGGVDEAAGVVHRGEVVWSQADIRRAGGVQLVERMRVSGDLGKLFRMPGFAKGGVVGGQVSPGASSRRAFTSAEIARLVAMPDVGAVTRVSGGAAPKQGRDLVDVRIGVDPRNGSIQPYVDRRAAQVASGLDAQAQRAQVRMMPDMIRDIQRRGT